LEIQRRNSKFVNIVKDLILSYFIIILTIPFIAKYLRFREAITSYWEPPTTINHDGIFQATTWWSEASLAPAYLELSIAVIRGCDLRDVREIYDDRAGD